MKITNPITLDVARSNSYICLLAKQFDSNSRYLEITLADNGQPLTIPADASVVLRATRADGTGAVVSGTVANGKATVEIDDYILEVAGAVTLSLEISKGGEILTTTHCNLTVQKADASGWIRVYIADSSKAAGNYYITIGGVSYSFTTSQAIPAGGSVYFSNNNATAETRNATGTVIETGLVLTEGTTGTQLVTDVPTMSFLATIAGRVAALESEMPNKADKDGIIALAENLTPYSSTSGATQSVPFINQGTGCGNGEAQVDTGSYAQVENKLGNTVCVNQLVADADKSFTCLTGTNTDKTLYIGDLIAGRKYIVMCYQGADVTTSERNTFYYNDGSTVYQDTHQNFNPSKGWRWWVFTPNNTIAGTGVVKMWVHTPSADVTYSECSLIDLTLWFGSNDRIPSHLLSHPEDFGRYYSGSLAYNPGQLKDADGSVLTSLPRNCFDGELESGSYNPSTGAKITNANAVRSKNLIPCIPNDTYYFRSATALPAQVFYVVFFDAQGNFVGANINGYYNATKTIPANAHFMGFWAGSATYPVTDTSRKFTISIYYSGESGYDEDYEYSVLAQIDTGSEVLRSGGSKRDTKAPDGSITRNVGVVPDMSALNWDYNGVRFAAKIIGMTKSSTDTRAKAICEMYARYDGPVSDAPDQSFICGERTDDQIYVKDSTCTDIASFKTKVANKKIFYDLATPTTEQGTPFSGASANNFAIEESGSMEWTQTNGVPQGVEIFYPYNYAGFLDQLIRAAGGDAGQIPNANPPTADGTYTFKATVSGGTVTYSWVAE